MRYAVVLPEELGVKNYNLILANMIFCYQETKAGEVNVDFSKLRFIETIGVVALINAIAYFRSKEIKVTILNENNGSKANDYLHRAGFFELFGLESRNYTQRPLTTIKARSITDEDYCTYLSNELIPWMQMEVNLGMESFSVIKTCLEEIFNNINDHSETREAFAIAQYFPKLNKINIAISDCGVSIPHNVRKQIDIADDSEAIGKAIEKGFSSRTNSRNSGVGLHILTNHVVCKNGGEVLVRSRLGCVTMSPQGQDKDGIRTVMNTSRHLYVGTLIHLTLRTDTLEQTRQDLNEESFVW